MSVYLSSYVSLPYLWACISVACPSWYDSWPSPSGRRLACWLSRSQALTSTVRDIKRLSFTITHDAGDKLLLPNAWCSKLCAQHLTLASIALCQHLANTCHPMCDVKCLAANTCHPTCGANAWHPILCAKHKVWFFFGWHIHYLCRKKLICHKILEWNVSIILLTQMDSTLCRRKTTLERCCKTVFSQL